MDRKLHLGNRILENPIQEKTHHSERGFVITLLLISLPVFISCLMVFTSLFFCIRNHDLAQSICLKYTLQAQEQMKKALYNLLKLNPQANQLRRTQKHLEHLYHEALKTGELITITALRIKLETIKQKRVLLDRKQKHILNQTLQMIKSAFSSFKQKMKNFHPGYIRKKHHQPIPLAVEAKPKGDIAPAYYPVPRFSLHQTFSLSWNMPLYRFLPKWITHHFFENQLSSYDCAATIKKRGTKWKTTLTSSTYLHAPLFTGEK